MKKLLLATALIAASSMVQAQAPVANSSYYTGTHNAQYIKSSNQSDDGESAFIRIEDQVGYGMIVYIVMPSRSCKALEPSFSEGAAFNVSGVKVKFNSKCYTNGYGIHKAATDAGIDYLVDSLMLSPTIGIHGYEFSNSGFSTAFDIVSDNEGI